VTHSVVWGGLHDKQWLYVKQGIGFLKTIIFQSKLHIKSSYIMRDECICLLGNCIHSSNLVFLYQRTVLLQWILEFYEMDCWFIFFEKKTVYGVVEKNWKRPSLTGRGRNDRFSWLLVYEEGRCKFHQHFTSSIFVQKNYAQLLFCLQFVSKFFWQMKIGTKAALNMLEIFRTKVFFTAFMCLKLVCNYFAARKMLVKLT